MLALNIYRVALSIVYDPRTVCIRTYYIILTIRRAGRVHDLNEMYYYYVLYNKK